MQPGVEFATHDGVSLRGGLYVPSATGPHPALVLLHGGAWQEGAPSFWRHWGTYLADQGYVAFAATYRLSRPDQPAYPQNAYDTKAAVQWLRCRARELEVDPERLGIMGSSAGGHLAALVALAGDAPQCAGPYADAPYRAASARVKVCVSVYGVFHLMRQDEWGMAKPRPDASVRQYLGGTPSEMRDVYEQASPHSWVTAENNRVAFLLAWGTADSIVDPASQSGPFVETLRRAGAVVEAVPIDGAAHGWMSRTPVLEPRSYTGYLAPRLLRFLGEHL